MAERQGGAGSPAGRTAGCLLLPSRFRRAEPAASPRASNTVITCGGVHGAQWMGIDRQGAFSALAPTTNGSMSVGDCQQRGMQPGHPEGRAGAQAAASVEHLGWTRSVLRGWPPSQGQRPWPTIDTPPWHSSRHASLRNAICCPTPPAFQPHFHPCQTGLHPALHTSRIHPSGRQYFLMTIASASQLADRIVSKHTTTHRAFSTRPGLVLLMSACLPSFALVHSLVAICWRAWVI